MKKRIQSMTAIIVMLALIMGLAACGSKESESNDKGRFKGSEGSP